MSFGFSPVDMSVLEGITSVVADSDLDGLMAAAILKAAKPEITVHFSHAALIRSGALDHLINRTTALCDLPFHPNCGLYLDHHMTNRPTPEQENIFVADGGICYWQDTPSAARAVYDLMKDEVDLKHLEEIMPIVDDLDSGQISLETFLEDGPIIRLSRSLSLREPEHMNTVLNQFATGMKLDEILSCHEDRLDKLFNKRKIETEIVRAKIKITNGLAICRLDNTEVRTNGYLVTALAGDDAIACCIIHGWVDGSIENPQRPALGASFYGNSFRDKSNPYDLSRLATSIDETGGGHANACGCRVKPLTKEGMRVDRKLIPEDVERNLAIWMDIWNDRENTLIVSTSIDM